MTKQQEFFNELETCLDDVFPKAKNTNLALSPNHRSEALVLFSSANLLFSKYLEEAIKEERINILMKAESMETAREVRHFIKNLLLKRNDHDNGHKT